MVTRRSSSLGKMRSSDQARSSESKMVRLSYAPWATNFFSNFCAAERVTRGADCERYGGMNNK